MDNITIILISVIVITLIALAIGSTMFVQTKKELDTLKNTDPFKVAEGLSTDLNNCRINTTRLEGNLQNLNNSYNECTTTLTACQSARDIAQNNAQMCNTELNACNNNLATCAQNRDTNLANYNTCKNLLGVDPLTTNKYSNANSCNVQLDTRTNEYNSCATQLNNTAPALESLQTKYNTCTAILGADPENSAVQSKYQNKTCNQSFDDMSVSQALHVGWLNDCNANLETKTSLLNTCTTNLDTCTTDKNTNLTNYNTCKGMLGIDPLNTTKYSLSNTCDNAYNTTASSYTTCTADKNWLIGDRNTWMNNYNTLKPEYDSLRTQCSLITGSKTVSGNNGTVSCDDWCRNSFSPGWGCLYGYDNITGKNLECSHTPGYSDGRNLSCVCSSQIIPA